MCFLRIGFLSPEGRKPIGAGWGEKGSRGRRLELEWLCTVFVFSGYCNGPSQAMPAAYKQPALPSSCTSKVPHTFWAQLPKPTLSGGNSAMMVSFVRQGTNSFAAGGKDTQTVTPLYGLSLCPSLTLPFF